MPYHLGAGQRAHASRLVTAAGVVQIGNGILFTAGAAIAALWIRDPQMRLALFAMAAVLMASQLHKYLRDVSLAHRDIDSRSRGLVLAALSDYFFSLSLAAKCGLVGLGIGTVLGFAVPAVYLWRRVPEFTGPRWNPAAWKELWLAGWSSAIADTGAVVLRYVDVAILTFVASPRMVGLYALSQKIVDLSGHLARVSLGAVVGPELAHQSSRGTLRQVAASLKGRLHYSPQCSRSYSCSALWSCRSLCRYCYLGMQKVWAPPASS